MSSHLTRDDIDKFEKLQSQLLSTHDEVSLLSKKSPNDGINKFKLHFTNSLIGQCNKLLPEEYHPFADFNAFSEDDIPTNSDVAFMVSQYLAACEKWRADNIKMVQGLYFWRLEDDTARVRTAPPKKLKGD